MQGAGSPVRSASGSTAIIVRVAAETAGVVTRRARNVAPPTIVARNATPTVNNCHIGAVGPWTLSRSVLVL